MSQLTQQIAAAYIGAQVYWNGNTQCHVIDVIRSECIHNMKLILTPLSHITDEDAVEVCNIVGERGAGNGKILRVIITVDLKIVLDFEKTRFSIPLSISIIDYLRSRNYDLGYMGIRSLIDADIAISSTDKTDSDVQP